MKEAIESKLQNLVGLVLRHTTRAADIQCLYLDEFSIHLQCSWRFIDSEKILVGSQDLYQPADSAREDFDWENFNWENNNLRDKKLKELINTNILIVENIEADSYGGVEIGFKNEVKLQIFPNSSFIEYSEYWRLVDTRGTETKHTVITAIGIEE